MFIFNCNFMLDFYSVVWLYYIINNLGIFIDGDGDLYYLLCFFCLILDSF